MAAAGATAGTFQQSLDAAIALAKLVGAVRACERGDEQDGAMEFVARILEDALRDTRARCLERAALLKE